MVVADKSSYLLRRACGLVERNGGTKWGRGPWEGELGLWQVYISGIQRRRGGAGGAPTLCSTRVLSQNGEAEVFRFLLIASVLCAACDRSASPRVRADGPVAAAAFRRPAAERIVAIGDLHGDVAATRAALRLAGALGPDDRWVGGKLVVVQTGDQLDRGDDEPEILDLLERLSGEASAAGGALHALNGNHEVMNVEGDFRYVTSDGFHDYAGKQPAVHPALAERVPEEQRGRAAAFLPGESVAKRLAKRPSILQVGANVFVHGGLSEQHVRYGIDRINKEVQTWMAAPRMQRAPSIAMSPDGPLWLRSYSDGVPSSSVCGELGKVLSLLSAKRLVVGHTVQEQGINSACDGRVWRIDVGLSRFYGRPPSVLEIRGDTVRAIKESARP